LQLQSALLTWLLYVVQFKGVKPVGDRVLVKVDKEEQKSMGGVLLPTAAQARPTAGSVVSAGDVSMVKVRHSDALCGTVPSSAVGRQTMIWWQQYAAVASRKASRLFVIVMALPRTANMHALAEHNTPIYNRIFLCLSVCLGQELMQCSAAQLGATWPSSAHCVHQDCWFPFTAAGW
jgi:co-chaperonin GroES (HSP10)